MFYSTDEGTRDAEIYLLKLKVVFFSVPGLVPTLTKLYLPKSLRTYKFLGPEKYEVWTELQQREIHLPNYICSLITIMVSSSTTTQQHQSEQGYSFNSEQQNIYNKLISSTRKFHLKNTNINFLENCVLTGTIPNSFKIKNQPHENSSSFTQTRWTSASRTASLQWMKIVIQEEKNQLHTIFNTLTNLKNKLQDLIPPEDFISIQPKLIQKNYILQQQAEAKREIKLTWLKTKQDIPIETDSQKGNRKKNKWIKRSKWKRLKKKQQTQKVSVVFNYSSLDLTEPMTNLLNRGLNFSITPQFLNLSQVLVDFTKFERKIRWKEFFAGSDQKEYIPPLFKKEKTNLPRNHKTPENLKMFIHGVKSELLDPENRNKVRPNLPPQESESLSKLIKLQRDKVITIKPCDKGAGIIILNFRDYVNSCLDHLNSKQTVGESSYPYYRQINQDFIDESKNKITSVLEEGKINKWISEDEYDAMCPNDKKPGKFYMLYKVHKKHEPGTIPPGRPIISGSGSFTENISIFVDHHLKPLADKHPSYLQDTPDFLRFIEAQNQSINHENFILFTVDVSSLYTNIPQEEGIQICEKTWNTRSDKTVPTSFLTSLLRLCLQRNLFTYGETTYQQMIGTAMGIHPAPPYANLFMADLDEKILNLGESKFPGSVLAWKRFLDDCFGLWKGNLEDLYKFLEEINKLHPTIRFTMEHSTPYTCSMINIHHDCWCHQTKSIPFLDTLIFIENQKLVTDLYRKPTDRCQYLLPSSCHPSHITGNIPFSLAYRIIRICSKPELLNKRLTELKELLLSRDYNSNIIDKAILKAKAIPRCEALKRVDTKKSLDRVVFSIEFNPRLPSLSTILQKHWRSMTLDPWLKEVFKFPPMIAFRRPQNLKDKLIRATLPETKSQRPQRHVPGMKACGSCSICPYIQKGNTVQSSRNNKSIEINSQVFCNSKNVIYCITCDKCMKQYIGKTERTLCERIREHLGYIRNKQLNQATGEHFNLPGHKIHHLKATVLEKVFKPGRTLIEIRESYFIQQFETEIHGLNKRK